MGDVISMPQPEYEFYPALQMYDPQTGNVSYLLQDASGDWICDNGEWSCEIPGLHLTLTLEDSDASSESD